MARESDRGGRYRCPEGLGSDMEEVVRILDLSVSWKLADENRCLCGTVAFSRGVEQADISRVESWYGQFSRIYASLITPTSLNITMTHTTVVSQ